MLSKEIPIFVLYIAGRREICQIHRSRSQNLGADHVRKITKRVTAWSFPKLAAATTVLPSGETVDQRIRSLIRSVVSGEQEHHWHDAYNWGKGTKFLHGMVTGDEMIELEKRGKAKTFDMTGEWSGKVTGSIPIIGPDGRVGEPAIDWTGGKAMAERRDP